VPAERLGAARWGRRGRYLVPLDAAAAGRWFLDRLFAPHGGRERALLRLARALPWAAARRLLLRPPRGGADPALALLDRALAAQPGLAAANGGGEGWLVVADHVGSARGRVVGFRFSPSAAAPGLVVKVESGPSAALAREAEGLRRLRGSLPPPLASTLPEVAGEHEAAGLAVLALAALPGRSGYVTARRGGVRRATGQLAAAGRWLAAFQNSTRRGDAEPPPAWRALAAAAGMEADDSPPAWYRALPPLPAVAAHGDFWPRNLLLAGAAAALPAVVDWEAWSDAASPLGDLFHYPFALGQLAGTRPLAAFRRTFVDDTPLSRRVVPYVRTVAAVHALADATLAPLFRLYLLAAAGGGMPVPSAFAEPAACRAAYHLVESSGCVFSG
jgi:hypothetical protein